MSDIKRIARHKSFKEGQDLLREALWLKKIAGKVENNPKAENALELLAQRRQLLDEELRTLDALARDEVALKKSGLSVDDVRGMQRELSDQLDEVQGQAISDLTLHLSGLEEMIPGALWRGTREQIDAMVFEASQQNPEVKATRDETTGVWRVELGRRTIEVQERAPADGTARFGSTEKGARMVVGDDPDLQDVASWVPPEEGTLDVIVHGSVDDFEVSGGRRVDHRVLAQMIRGQHPDGTYERIRLVACRAGVHPKGVAQHLANKLDVDVIAPSDLLHVSSDGTMVIGPHRTRNTGKWETFSPKQSARRSTPAADPADTPTTPRERLEAHKEQVRAIVKDKLEELGVAGIQYDTKVLDAKKFDARFGDERGTAAVVIEDDGTPVIYAKVKASPADLAHEAVHLAQLADTSNPRLQENIRLLSAENMKTWDKADIRLKKELAERQLEVELDATQRELDAASVDERPELEQRIAAMRSELEQIQSLTDEQLAEISAGVATTDLLDRPAYLFKREVSKGKKLDAFKPKTEHDRTPVRNSSWATDGAIVERLGSEWTETLFITSAYEGKVIAKTETADGILIDIDAGGTIHRYVVNSGGEPKVRVGTKVHPGKTLAHENSRRTRLVEVTRPDGTFERRTEELIDGKWRQAGDHTRLRGDLVEVAARRQVDQELRAEMWGETATPDGKEKLVEVLRIDHQDQAGRGFDDVIVEFRGDPPVAHIRIVETKDYPNKSVPKNDITAIRKNMDKNLTRLRDLVDEALGGAKVAGLDGVDDLNKVQLILDALNADRVQVEMRLGPTTRISKRTMEDVRAEIDDRFGPGSFVMEETNVKQEHIDEVVTDRYGDPRREP
jgi:hypothetical protein